MHMLKKTASILAFGLLLAIGFKIHSIQDFEPSTQARDKILLTPIINALSSSASQLLADIDESNMSDKTKIDRLVRATNTIADMLNAFIKGTNGWPRYAELNKRTKSVVGFIMANLNKISRAR
ncbi:MAG TPA: hypothetical protein VHA52_12505 [Candidatus Babeliaceae bacterium]|nr:hypothetical protein [Candidatus Babeliaceae bacterium]